MYEIIDNAYSARDRDDMFEFVRNSKYRIGWADRNFNDVNGQRRIMYSPFTLDEVEDMGVLRLHNSPRIDELVRGRTPTQNIINLAEPSNVFCPHTHGDLDTLLYYCNTRWAPEWAGETIIYSEHDYEAEHAVSFKPGRVLWLNAGVMHSVRPPSQAAPDYRFTFAAFFSTQD